MEHIVEDACEEGDEAAGSAEDTIAFIESVREMKTRLKIMTSFLQIERIVSISFRLPMPVNFEKFLSTFDFLEFAIFSGVSGDCVASMDYFTGLLFNTLAPMVALLLLAIYRRSTPNPHMKERISYLMILLTFMVLPTATTLVIFTYQCDTLTPTRTAASAGQTSPIS